MDWLQIGAAAGVIIMMVLIFPRLRHSMKESSEAKNKDWMSVIIPIALVALFVILLTKMV